MSSTPVPDPFLNRQLGDYTIQELLGQGGMARVYRGYDKRLDRHAAVKVIDARMNTSNESEAEYRERFQREARAIARLKHNNIVGVYQFGEEGTMYYMAMAYIEGRDLRQMLKDSIRNKTFMPYKQVLSIIKDIAYALDYAHAEGVIHRDIKPSNIMVTPSGQAVLMDFGLALSVPEGSMGGTFGSVHYIAPEQAVSSARAVPQSDLYSLGIVLYEMLTNRVPFDDQSTMSVALKQLSDPPPTPSKINPKITPQIEMVVLRMLDKDPKNRYQSGINFVRALEHAIQQSDEESTANIAIADVALAAKGNKSATIKSPNTLPNTATSPKPLVAEDQKSLYTDTQNAYKLSPSISKRLGTKTTPPPKIQKLPSQQERRRLPVAWIAAAVILLLIGVAGAWVFNSNPALFGGATGDGTAVVLGDMTASPTFNRAATLPPVTVTDTPPTATALPPDQPTDTPPSPTPNIVGILSPTPDTDAQIILAYDNRTIVIRNRDDLTVNIKGLRFVQTLPDTNTITFGTDDFTNNNRLLESFKSGDCFQAWTNNFSRLPSVDAVCPRRQGFRQVRANLQFWLSDVPGATFDIYRDDELLGTCPASPRSDTISEFQFECAVDIRDIR
jgi:serine/threonine protein kinase